jgi:cyclic pyranopterin phosphate synthase
MFASLYVTHRCNLACVYCCDGEGKPFYEIGKKELPKEKVFVILDRIVKSVKVLNITGGEPLLREDIYEIVKYAKDIGFKEVFLNTNGLLIDEKMKLLDPVDTLYVSLDSLSENKLKDYYRVDNEKIKKILNNLEVLSSSKYSTKIAVSMVILPDNIRDVYEVLEYCGKRKIGFTASPVLRGNTADKALIESDEYTKCIDKIIECKNKRQNIIGSVTYYKIIRDFKKYQCYAFLTPTIDPEGRLYIPCLERNEKLLNLMDFNSLDEAVKHGLAGYEYPPKCGNVCHILCHAGLSVLFENLSVPVRELCGI